MDVGLIRTATVMGPSRVGFLNFLEDQGHQLELNRLKILTISGSASPIEYRPHIRPATMNEDQVSSTFIPADTAPTNPISSLVLACLNSNTELALSIIYEHRECIEEGMRNLVSPLYSCLRTCCGSDNIEIARMLIETLQDTVVTHLMDTCVLLNSLKIMRVILTDYRHTISERALSVSFFCACAAGNLKMVNLLIDNFDRFDDYDVEGLSRATFEYCCDMGNETIIKLLQTRCGY